MGQRTTQKVRDTRPPKVKKEEASTIPIKEGNSFFMARVFPYIDLTQKVEVRFGLIVGPPGSGKTTNAIDIISTIIVDEKRPDITRENTNWKIVNSVVMFFQMLNTQRNQIFVFDDSFDDLTSRQSMSADRIRDLKAIFRVRHIEDERKRDEFIKQHQDIFEKYKDDLEKLDRFYERGGLIVLILTCQSIAIEKGILDMLTFILFKWKGLNQTTTKITRDYTFHSKKALAAIDDIMGLLTDPMVEIRNIGRSLMVFKIFNYLGMLTTFKMHKNNKKLKWNKLPKQEISVKEVKKAQKERVMTYIDDMIEATEGIKGLTNEIIEGYFFIREIEISKSDLAALKKAYKTIQVFADGGIDIRALPPVDSSGEQKGGMSDESDSIFSLPTEVSALLEREMILWDTPYRPKVLFNLIDPLKEHWPIVGQFGRDLWRKSWAIGQAIGGRVKRIGKKGRHQAIFIKREE